MAMPMGRLIAPKMTRQMIKIANISGYLLLDLLLGAVFHALDQLLHQTDAHQRAAQRHRGVGNGHGDTHGGGHLTHDGDLLHQMDTLHGEPQGEDEPQGQHHGLGHTALIAGELADQRGDTDVGVLADGVGRADPDLIEHDVTGQLLSPDSGGVEPAEHHLHEDDQHHGHQGDDEEPLFEVLFNKFPSSHFSHLSLKVIVVLHGKVDQLLCAAVLLNEQVVHGGSGLDEGVLLLGGDLHHVDAVVLQQLDVTLLRIADQLGQVLDEVLRGLIEPFLVLTLQGLVEVLVDVEDTGGVEVAGEGHGVLHLVQAVGGDDGQGILLGVHGALLQGGEQLRERHGRGAGAPGLEGGHVNGVPCWRG